MRTPFGGEAPYGHDGVHTAMVHCGRAALRLLIAGGLKKKTFLVPDFLCGVIIDVLRRHRVKYGFYRVKADLAPDLGDIRARRFDVLYVVNYFGQKTVVPKALLKGRMLIVDDVFAPILEAPQGVKDWAALNSLRKVTVLAEGAFVSSTRPLALKTVDHKPAAFAVLKYKAKQMKADHLAKGKGSQFSYLRAFVRAETGLDGDQGIHAPSVQTMGLLPSVLLDIGKEQGIRRRQYAMLDGSLRRYSVPLRPRYFSFYVLSVERRDALKKHLADRGIFLPAHWPRVAGADNPLYSRLLSIPLDSRYNEGQLRAVASAIRGFLS